MTIEQIKTNVQEYLSALTDDDKRIKAINDLKEVLHELSPIADPVDVVKWVDADLVIANEYNPNKVAPPEMKLLYVSIKEDGYTQPIVCYPNDDGTYEVVDGFHRNRVGKEHKDIKKRTKGKLPIVVINKEKSERMASTIRHNRARGKHGVAPMGELVAALSQAGWEDSKIAEHLGMQFDEVLRLKQVSGIAELFKNREYSRSWDVIEKG